MQTKEPKKTSPASQKRKTAKTTVKKEKKVGKKKPIRRYSFVAVKSNSIEPVVCEVISTGPTCAQHEFDKQYPGWTAWNYDDPFFVCYTEDPGELFPNAIKTALDLERAELSAAATLSDLTEVEEDE